MLRCYGVTVLRRFLKSLAIIPELIRSSIFIGEVVNEKDINDYDSFRYYVVGLQMEGVDYTVKLVIGVKNGTTYYDHALTPIGKEKLLRSIDEIKRPFASKESLYNGELIIPDNCRVSLDSARGSRSSGNRGRSRWGWAAWPLPR